MGHTLPMGLIREPLCTARAPALLREAHVTRNPMHSTKYTPALALLQRQHTECECTSFTLRLSVRILSPAANFCSLGRISWKDIFRNWATASSQSVLYRQPRSWSFTHISTSRHSPSFTSAAKKGQFSVKFVEFASRKNPTELCLDKSIVLPLGHRRTR